ncbi:MAG: VWA domain-containing protein [Pseudomonadota bacterium]
MFQIEWPMVLAMLPLPFLIYYLIPRGRLAQNAALKVPGLGDFEQAANTGIAGHRPWWKTVSLLAWVLLVLAASRPQWVGESISIPVSGRDLLLAVDLSDSMRTGDFKLEGEQVNRLQATKQVASAFIERRKGDRLGLILFGSRAYVQAPLTFDTKTVNRLLQESVIGLAGERTAIGDAIGLAIKRLDDQSSQQRVLILMTDGTNTAGVVSPLQAAQLAAKNNLKIYTIGIGADPEIRTTWFGLRQSVPTAQLDEDSLRKIAALSGGQYFRARDSKALEHIYRLLDDLEPMPADEQERRPVAALFMWPLAAALGIALLMALYPLWRRT